MVQNWDIGIAFPPSPGSKAMKQQIIDSMIFKLCKTSSGDQSKQGSPKAYNIKGGDKPHIFDEDMKDPGQTRRFTSNSFF